MEKELNVFIIWEKGRYLSEPIIADIAAKFTILQSFNISWPKKSFAARLAQFYGKNLPKGCRKEKECGCGDFLLIVVEDEQPAYHEGKNINMTTAKGLYRQWFQGKNYVHCSDCQAEGEANVQYLLGINAEEFRTRFNHPWDGKIINRHAPISDDGLRNSWADWLNDWGRQLLQNLNLW